MFEYQNIHSLFDLVSSYLHFTITLIRNRNDPSFVGR